MHLSIKNAKDFPDDQINEIVNWIMSKGFTSLLAQDLKTMDDPLTRQIHHVSKCVYVIRASTISISNVEELDTLHLASVEKHGHVNLFKVGTEPNKTSILYWILFTSVNYVLPTGHGIVVVESAEKAKGIAKVYDRPDNFWLMGNEGSTVAMLDYGSSHLIT